MDIQQAADEFLSFLQIEKNASPNTIRSYAFDLQVYRAFMVKTYPGVSLTDLDSTKSRRFVQDQVINHQTKPRTLQRRISCLKSFSGYCLKERWTENDFMAGISAPKADKKLPVYLRQSELQQLTHHLELQESDHSLRDELIVKLFTTSGLRRQELVDLCWRQLDFDVCTIRIHGKGNKERLLPLHPGLLPLFEKYRDSLPPFRLHESEPVFANRFGAALNPRGLHRLFKAWLEHAGLPPSRFSLHHLRHTFATMLLNQPEGKQVDLRTLQELLGHESLSTTGIYTHINMEQKKRAVENLLV